MDSRPFLVIVDDDESLRESLPDLLVALGFGAQAFMSAKEFLASDALARASCLILDIAMPGMSGPELQQELLARGHSIPIVFITAQVDETMREALMQRGAVACLLKPFSEKDLQVALESALGTPPRLD